LNYVLTRDAEADLRGIVRQTRKEWGEAQVRTYVAKLKAGIDRVAVVQGVFKNLDALYPALRMARCEHH
jgi:toxin ParE1/3/4